MFKRLLIIYAAISIAVLGLLLYAGARVHNEAAHEIVVKQSEEISLAWANFIGDHLERIEEISQGGVMTPTERRFLDSARRYGDVFRFKLFDRNGDLRLISDDLNSDLSNNPDIGHRSEGAKVVLRTGKPVSDLKDGSQKPNRPDLYSETYVPVVRDGRMVAVAEVYIDRTQEAAKTEASFVTFGREIAVLIFIAVMIPCAGLIGAILAIQSQNKTLNRERKRAVEAERAKSQFLAHMSHELRTPLNCIHGMSQMLLRGDLGTLENEKHKEYLNDIHDSGAHLLDLVNDVLDISRLDSEKYELHESEFDLAHCVLGAVRVVKGWGEAAKLTINASEIAASAYIRADRRAIYQSVMNVLANAVKFTAPGGNISLHMSTTEDGSCTVTVEDNGCGVAEKDLPTIFDRFSSIDSSGFITKEKGAGLGLPLVKSLMELHGGSVLFESKEGVGTKVTLLIPAERFLPSDTRAA